MNKSIFSQFFSGALAIGTARVFSVMFGLVSVMITVRNVSTEDYGAYILLTIILSFLVEFTSWGLSLAIPKFMASNEDEEYQKQLLDTVFFFRILTVIAVILIGLIAKPIIIRFWGESIVINLLVFISILYGLDSFTHLFSSILRGKFDFTAIGLIEFAAKVGELIALAVLLLYMRLGLTGLIIAKMLSSLFSSIVAYYATRHRYKFSISMGVLKEMLKFGFPLQMTFIFSYIFSRIDSLIVGSMLGTSGIAFYEIARKIPDTLSQFYSVFISVYFPITASLFASEQKEKTERLLGNSIRMLSFITLLGSLITVLFGRQIIILMFSDVYLSSYLTFILLMIGLSLNFLEETLGYSLIAIGESDKPLIVNIVRMVVNVAGNLLLLPVLGFLGAGLASIISNIVAVPLDTFFLWKKNIRSMLFEYLKPFFIFGIGAAIFIQFGSQSLVFKIALILAYLISSLLFSVINISDITAVFNEAKGYIVKFISKKDTTEEDSIELEVVPSED